MDIKSFYTARLIKRQIIGFAFFFLIGLSTVSSLKAQSIDFAANIKAEKSIPSSGSDKSKHNKHILGPVVTFTPGDTTMCVGMSHALLYTSTSTGTGTLIFKWSCLHGIPMGPTNTGVFGVFWATIPTSGYDTIKLVVTDGAGLKDSITHIIHLVDCADFYASDYSVCLDTCVYFTDNSTGNPVQWRWTFGATTANATPHSFISNSGATNDSFCVKFHTPGWHTVSLSITKSNGQDTVSTKTNLIFVGACPHASFSSTIPSSDTICSCKCVNFTNTSISDPNSEGQRWYFYSGLGLYDSTRERNPTVCFSTPGTYHIILVDTNNVGKDSIHTDSVVVIPCTKPSANIAITSGKDSICQGQCLSFADTTCNGATNVATKWKWFFNGGTQSISGSDTIQNPTDICFNSAGTFHIKMVDSNVVANVLGYDSAYKTIVVLPSPNINLSSHPESIINKEITLIDGTNVTIVESGNDPYAYYWSFTPPYTSLPFQHPDSLSCDTCLEPYNPVADPTVSHWYYVSTVGLNGCRKIDSIYINVVKSSQIYVPNAFAPFGNAPNGANRKLFVRSTFVRTLYFAVYDKWGEKVWETTSQDEGWDGTYNGKPMNNGVYDWYLKATLYNGKQVQQKGNVTLIR